MARDNRQKARDRIKSRFAEGLVEALLEEAGNKVRRFGQELQSTACQEPSIDIFKYEEHSEKVRCKPDLLIKNLKGEVEAVEVKFSLSDLIYDHLYYGGVIGKLRAHWPKTRMIIIRPEHSPFIQVLNPPYVDKSWDPVEVHLCKIPEWGITHTMFEAYVEFVRKFPKDIL